MTKRAINLVADGPPVNGARVGTKPSSRRKPYDDKSQDMTRESHSHLVDQDRTTALLPSHWPIATGGQETFNLPNPGGPYLI